jgi:hypothetical protein
MDCPRTNTLLNEVSIGDTKVYFSSTGGVFFDNRQIFHFSDPNLKTARCWSHTYKHYRQNALILPSGLIALSALIS